MAKKRSSPKDDKEEATMKICTKLPMLLLAALTAYAGATVIHNIRRRQYILSHWRVNA